jgi:hypothetical protein
MTGKEPIEERLENLGRAIGPGESIVDDVMSRIDACPVGESDRTRKSKAELIALRFIMSRFTKLAAAAVIIIGVLAGVYYLGSSVVPTTPAYGITDVPELFQTAKTIHMKGRMYFLLSKPGHQQSSVDADYWLDIENGKWRLTHPGYSTSPEGIKIHVSENISDGEYEMHVNHTDKTASFSKLSPFQRRLFTRKNIYTFLELLYVNFALFDYIKVGQEVIDGAVFDIWEGTREDNLGNKMKLKTWLSPTTGNFARLKSWTQKEDGSLVKQMEIDSVERDIEIPYEIFATEAPAGYALSNTKDTAILRELTIGSVGTDSVSLSCHIIFTMADGSVIVGWSSEDRQSEVPQAELFEDLKIGGQLPKLAAEVCAIKVGCTDEDITYTGYHLAHTQKGGKFYEWSIYVADKQPSPNSVLGYGLLHRYNPESREVNAKISLSMAAELTIEKAEEFDTFVLGAMAELSDDGRAPADVAYEGVLELVEQIRESLVE